jgi:hypothetical protein
MNLILTNWKTSLAGVSMILGALADVAHQAATGQGDPNRLWANVMAVSGGVGLLFARDAKTSLPSLTVASSRRRPLCGPLRRGSARQSREVAMCGNPGRQPQLIRPLSLSGREGRKFEQLSGRGGPPLEQFSMQNQRS